MTRAFSLLLAIALLHHGGVAAKVAEPLTLALTGDSIIMQRLSCTRSRSSRSSSI
jgi:hypothetical protein